MTQITRGEAAWKRIEAWLASNLPAALDNLRPPATEPQLAELEAKLDRALPPTLRALLTLHDGENDGWVPSAFPDDHWLLPSAQIAEMWEQLVSLAEATGAGEDLFDFWKAQVEDGIIFIQGPVKPYFGSCAWIPFSSLDGHVQRFVDYDPAPGGAAGQVIEIDPEGCIYRVLASSLTDFLEEYAAALERGDFTIDDGGLRSAESDAADPTQWGVPAYLAEVPFATASPDPSASSIRPVDPHGETTLEGEMGFLMGGPETLFSLRTVDGREHTFLAKPGVTTGYASIAVRQAARVRARSYSRDVESYFVDQAGTEPPDFVALEYTMLR